MPLPYLQVPVAAERAMTMLSTQWYKALVGCTGLSSSEFQFVQGQGALGHTSEALWRILDQAPPETICHRYDPLNERSIGRGYSNLFDTVLAAGAQRFRDRMGAYYALWENDKVNLDPLPTTALEWMRRFVDWASVNLPMAMTQKCISHYKTALLDPIFMAPHLLANLKYASRNPGVHAYTLTAEKLRTLLDTAAPQSLQVRSSDTSSQTTGAWSNAHEGGIFNFAGRPESCNHITPTLKIADAGVSIRCSFEKLVSVRALPLERASCDPELKDFSPWFSPSALQGVYESRPDPDLNPKGAAIWEKSFGPNGNLQRFCAGLVIADGIKLSLTSKACLSVDEQIEFSRGASTGVFPFYGRSGEGGWFTDWIFDQAGNVTVSSSCKRGNPQLLGVLVKRIGDMLG